ncbi:hypothetical protein AWV80_09915 [Cupriavidus sp. UYMU48A]|nr:hypothetical protein AWV80_09915 [Cupriavidus sp. UYMU48A]
MTQHVDSGEPLPRALFERMLAAKNFQNGMMTLRQIVFSSFDMHLHTDFDPHGAKSVLDLSREINDRVHVVPQYPLSRWPNTFSHIFAGGYAAGYYSYKWAEVLSADVYAASRKPRSSPARCSTAKPARATSARSCRSAVAAPRWIHSSRSAAARRRSMRCCATEAWQHERHAALLRSAARRQLECQLAEGPLAAGAAMAGGTGAGRRAN